MHNFPEEMLKNIKSEGVMIIKEIEVRDTFLYTKKLTGEMAKKFLDKEILENDMDWFKDSVNKENLIVILNEILNNEELLSVVANRSYTHALGFDKIVLIDLSKDIQDFPQKVQLRFHLWDNSNDALSDLESMHEHSFNFISTVLTGRLENQSFVMSDLNDSESLALNKLKEIVSKTSDERLLFLNGQIEIYEAMRLAQIGSIMFDDQKMSEKFHPDILMSEFGLGLKELDLITSIQGHYLSDRIAGNRDSYKHILSGYKLIDPINVEEIKEGGYYFHSYEYPHRLYYDRKILNSTVLITTPIKENPQGGSLQRMTYQKEDVKGYDKIKLTKESLSLKIKKYLNQIELMDGTKK